ncbi:uracil-xanthine permease family protein [Streptomyces mesophilus]|uniref:uracil-xanthine permease family protein n=1 Tax=Streptomyces mesophilus TaxID=1775132 RepID=UPI00331ADCB3
MTVTSGKGGSVERSGSPGESSAGGPGGSSAGSPVDERIPLRRLAPLAVQHVLAMIAAPISTVFLTATALHLTPARTASLLSTVLVLCGLGALLQSLGRYGFGARLPFVMLPGGAAAALFLQIAQDHGAAVASGSVLLAGGLLLAVLPLYARVVRLFPPLVMGVTVLLIGIAMVRVAAQLVTGQEGHPGRSAVVLAAITIGATFAAFVLLRGVWRQTAVLLGMVTGTLVAAATGLGEFTPAEGAGWALPSPFPYGTPQFDLLAALPLLIFSLTTLAEITGQTVLNSETVGRDPRPAQDVPRVARADAAVSLLGGVFGTSLMVTSSENVGLTKLTGVRSRYVTAAAGVLLLAAGLLAPLPRLLAGIPAPVVGGSGLVVYAMIAVMGADMLHRAELRDNAQAMVAALALAIGLAPVVAPGLYGAFPGWVGTVLGSGVVAGTLTAVLLHAVLRLAGRVSPEPRPRTPDREPRLSSHS